MPDAGRFLGDNLKLTDCYLATPLPSCQMRLSLFGSTEPVAQDNLNRAVSFWFYPKPWLWCAPRVSSDKPRLKAFCRVAPSVRLKVRAIFAALVLLPASFFSVRISSAVHARLFFISELLPPAIDLNAKAKTPRRSHFSAASTGVAGSRV